MSKKLTLKLKEYLEDNGDLLEDFESFELAFESFKWGNLEPELGFNVISFPELRYEIVWSVRGWFLCLQTESNSFRKNKSVFKPDSIISNQEMPIEIRRFILYNIDKFKAVK